MSAPRPSGEQVELTFEDQRAVVVEVGGGLREYEVAGRPVLDGYGAEEMCSVGRGQVLVPWPNRLRDGTYTHSGEEHQLPLSEPARGNAIHGLVRWLPFEVVVRAPEHVTMGTRLRPQPGYPFTLELRIDYRLGPGGLEVHLAAVNAGDRSAPFGAGFHPYVTAGTPRVDSARLQAPGTTLLVTDDRAIPVDRRRVDGEYDFLQPRPIGPVQLDTAYTDLRRDADGLARVVLAGEQRTVTLWMDAACTHLMLFTGDTLPEERRRRSLGVEPMTCAPNAFQSGDGLRILEPQESAEMSWGISVS